LNVAGLRVRRQRVESFPVLRLDFNGHRYPRDQSCAEGLHNEKPHASEDRDEPILIRGRLPSSEAVRRFIEEADPDLARKVGAHASSLLVEALGSHLESRLAIRTSPRPRGSGSRGRVQRLDPDAGI
jgi:hypothetical protein